MDTNLVDQKVPQIVEEALVEMLGYFLVEVHIQPSRQIQVLVDADEGASIDRLAALNRQLYRKIEEAALFPPGDFALEVSSPGLEEPLKLFRQYRKNIGRTVEILLTDGTKNKGKLLEVQEQGITLEEPKGKKKQETAQQLQIAFEQIKYTKVCVVF